MTGCLAVFILLGMLGTVGAISEGNWGAAWGGILIFFVIPIGGALIALHQEQQAVKATLPPSPPPPKPVTILTCSKCFKHYPQTGREQEWHSCPECEVKA